MPAPSRRRSAPRRGDQGAAFPWLLHDAPREPPLPPDAPLDILYDGARVAALLDVRQLLGSRSDVQERLTHILMDHDLSGNCEDYLIPAADSAVWQTLDVGPGIRTSIAQRIRRLPQESVSHRVSWHSDTEIWVGRHRITVRPRDVEALSRRWLPSQKADHKRLEIARLLALYSVLDSPMSHRRTGVHLALDPALRRGCDCELFASPLNAVCQNGHFASKWPHIEWRFGSMGSYPAVLSTLPPDAVVCVNPPFTDIYLNDVMSRLPEMKGRLRLRLAIPIKNRRWRKRLCALRGGQLLKEYYDASSEGYVSLVHPTLFWEDPRIASKEFTLLPGRTLVKTRTAATWTAPEQTEAPEAAWSADFALDALALAPVGEVGAGSERMPVGRASLALASFPPAAPPALPGAPTLASRPTFPRTCAAPPPAGAGLCSGQYSNPRSLPAAALTFDLQMPPRIAPALVGAAPCGGRYGDSRSSRPAAPPLDARLAPGSAPSLAACELGHLGHATAPSSQSLVLALALNAAAAQSPSLLNSFSGGGQRAAWPPTPTKAGFTEGLARSASGNSLQSTVASGKDHEPPRRLELRAADTLCL